MKGVSDIVAMLLMLIITIGLAGLAYAYITGVFTTRTAVVLNIDSGSSSCPTTSTMTVYVRNDGTQTSGSVSVTATGGTTAVTCPNIAAIPAGGSGPSACTGRTGAGYYQISAIAGGSIASGSIYCGS